MLIKKELTRDQIFQAIEKGDFGNEVVASENKVIIVMTQDWCPQWVNMRNWLYEIETEENIDVYEIIYNKKDYYQEFMSFKENKFGNYSVPYTRYYKDGKLEKAFNYVSRTEFKKIMEI